VQTKEEGAEKGRHKETSYRTGRKRHLRDPVQLHPHARNSERCLINIVLS
jgi:hypothetical protein